MSVLKQTVVKIGTFKQQNKNDIMKSNKFFRYFECIILGMKPQHLSNQISKLKKISHK